MSAIHFRLKEPDMKVCVACESEEYGKFCSECGSKLVEPEFVEVYVKS